MEPVTIYIEGVSRGNPGPSAIGVYICDTQGTLIQAVSQSIGNATDNFAQYHAVMRGLQVALEHFGAKTNELHFALKLTSELVKKQLNAELQIKEPGLVPYFIEIHNLRVSSFPNLTFSLIDKESNKEAVRLANEALEA